MEENSTEMQAERYHEKFIPEQLFFRVLEGDPDARKKWDDLQPHIQNLHDSDGGVSAAHSLRTPEIALSMVRFAFDKFPYLANYIDPRRLSDIVDLGGRLHDIAKGTKNPDGTFKYREILLSDQPLTPEQRKLMDEHAADGAKILADIGLPPEIVRIADEHHNSGFRSIWFLPTELITIADVLEAVTSNKRPYIRTPMSKQKAYELVANTVLSRLGGREVKDLYKQWEPVYEGK